MARSDTGTIILYGGGIVLSYYILKSMGIITEPCSPSVCTPECPKGPEYSRGYFESCAPGYLDCGILTPKCCCISAPSAHLSSDIRTWKPLSEQELNNMSVDSQTSDLNANLYKDSSFEARTGRGRLRQYNFAGK
ncbi:MAG: hypothetical protein PHP08_00340 [Candidatus Dojkabacteria bacterium]|nr:hypothetical protein [Candidatus Dojkabacteria bacterium]